MRLQLIALTLVAGAARAEADNTFAAKTQVYADSDHTTVVSPVVEISHDAWRGSTLHASYVADIVSSASIDVVSNATRHMSDFRSEVSAGLVQKLRDTTLSAGYIYSKENDYFSHNVSLGIAQDLFQHNTTLALSWNLSHNDVGRAGDAAFERQLLVTGFSASYTQVLARGTIAQASYTYAYNAGYQASPYRFVPIYSLDPELATYKVPETEPKVRHRHAVVVALNQHLFRDSVLHADYRLYIDDWGLLAHTVQLQYTIGFRGASFRVRERFYRQAGADFYERSYSTPQTYMTTDRELSTFWSNLVGARVAYRIPKLKQELEIEAKGDFFYFHYDDFALLASRTGGTAELGMSLVY